MAYPWTTFGPWPVGTNLPLSEFDQNFSDVAAMAVVPCVVSGSASLILTGIITGFSITSYFNYMTFGGIAVSTNTGAVQARYGTLPNLPVYKDSSSGPVPLTGGEIVTNNALWLTYDSTLNGSAGGFHLQVGPGVLLGAYLPLTGGTLTGGLLGTTAAFSGAVSALSNSVSALAFSGQLGVTDKTTSITNISSGSASLSFGSIAAGGFSDQPISIANASIGDVVALGYPAGPLTSGIVYNGYVSIAGIVMVRAQNITAGSVLPTGGTYRATLFRSLP